MKGGHVNVNELDGRVAIVTGGAGGLGRGIVERFVAEGARVVIADLNVAAGKELAESLGPAALFRAVDVADPEDVRGLVEFSLNSFGGLHVMVNNAGVSGTMHRSFLDDDLADFSQVMGVNVLGVLAGTTHAARHMATAGGGSIINVSSIGGLTAGRSVITYRASKAAVIHASKSAAIALAEYDIRVNCIAPGNITTPLLASSVAGQADADATVAATRQKMAATAAAAARRHRRRCRRGGAVPGERPVGLCDRHRRCRSTAARRREARSTSTAWRSWALSRRRPDDGGPHPGRLALGRRHWSAALRPPALARPRRAS